MGEVYPAFMFININAGNKACSFKNDRTPSEEGF